MSGVRTAVIIGASVTGALAAGILTKFDTVIVVDADALHDTSEHRPGAPHARHFHGLLTRGRLIMEEIYPGFTQEAIARSAPYTASTRDARNYRRYG